MYLMCLVMCATVRYHRGEAKRRSRGIFSGYSVSTDRWRCRAQPSCRAGRITLFVWWLFTISLKFAHSMAGRNKIHGAPQDRVNCTTVQWWWCLRAR